MHLALSGPGLFLLHLYQRLRRTLPANVGLFPTVSRLPFPPLAPRRRPGGHLRLGFNVVGGNLSVLRAFFFGIPSAPGFRGLESTSDCSTANAGELTMRSYFCNHGLHASQHRAVTPNRSRAA